MNYGRLIAAAVAATVVDAVFGFVVYGNLLTSQFARFPTLFRPVEAQAPYMPGMFLSIFVGMIVATLMYRKGYEGGSAVVEGVRFGLMVGVLTSVWRQWIDYATMPFDLSFTLIMTAVGIVEWMIDGVVIGLIDRPRSLTKS